MEDSLVRGLRRPPVAKAVVKLDNPKVAGMKPELFPMSNAKYVREGQMTFPRASDVMIRHSCATWSAPRVVAGSVTSGRPAGRGN